MNSGNRRYDATVNAHNVGDNKIKQEKRGATGGSMLRPLGDERFT
jgi:hypothetical protein